MTTMETAKPSALIATAAVLFAAGCSGDTTRHIDPSQLAMNSTMAAAFDDGEVTLFESYVAVNLPVRRPNAAELSSLRGAVKPFDRHPWVTTKDVRVQMTWTLANMDKDDHTVGVLIDPWNEFGRYVPGVTQVGDDEQPNLSGYDELYDLPGLDSDRSSRIVHTTSFDEMDELATDFATAINIFAEVMPPPMAMPGEEQPEDPRVSLVNHAFNLQNRHGSDPYTDGYTPSVIPALVGFNLGLRTAEKANLVLEYSIEIVDSEGNRILEEGSKAATLEAADTVYTLGEG
jgi:hypothetical protein